MSNLGDLANNQPALAPSEEAAVMAGLVASAARVGNIGTWQAHVALGISLWSPAMYGMLRLPQGSGQEPLERFGAMVIEEDQPIVANILQALQDPGSYPPVTLRLRGGDGSLRHLVSSGQRTPSLDPAAAFYVGINIDVTAQVEQQAKLAATESTLVRNAGVIDSMLQHVPIGIAISIDGEITHVSRFATDMIGMNPEVGTHWDAWQIYHLDGKTAATKDEQALARAARGETIRMEQWYIRTAHGELLPVACNAGPIKGSGGETIGAVVAWYDITAFRDAEQSERVARLAAETAVRQRETFAASVAHELRTPLSAIAGWTQVLDRNPNPSLLERGVKAISTSVQGMSRILDDFLDLARINAGKLVTTRVRVEFAEIVHASVEALQPIAAGARVVVQWSPPAEAVLVFADPLRMQQAVLNLLSNAVKYSTEGGLVLVTLEAEAQQAVLRISDYGQGIDPEDLPHIFDEFYQADRSSARKGGLGLGLTISRHIVRSHEGRIRADSRGPGRGAIFTIELPRL